MGRKLFSFLRKWRFCMFVQVVALLLKVIVLKPKARQSTMCQFSICWNLYKMTRFTSKNYQFGTYLSPILRLCRSLMTWHGYKLNSWAASITLQFELFISKQFMRTQEHKSRRWLQIVQSSKRKEKPISGNLTWIEYVGPTLLRSLVDVGWDLLCTLQWVGSCFNRPPYIVFITTNLPCNPNISQHKYWWEGVTTNIWILGRLYCVSLRHMQIYHSGDVGLFSMT